MRRLRRSRLFAAAVALALGTANPASVLAHAVAHHRDADGAQEHVLLLEAHGASAELSAPDRANGHPHARLDRFMRTNPDQLALGPAVPVSAPALDPLAVERDGPIPVSSSASPDPPGNDPPRLRAPPLS